MIMMMIMIMMTMMIMMMMIKVLSKDSQGGCLTCDPGYVYTLTFDNRYTRNTISQNSTNGVQYLIITHI